MLSIVLFAICSVTRASQLSTCTDIHGGDWTLVRHAYNAWHPATDNLAGTDVYGTYDNDPQSTSNWSISYSEALEDDGSTVFMFSNGDCSEFLITSNDQFITSQNGTYLARIIASHYDTNVYNVTWNYTSIPWLSWQNASHASTLLYGEASNINHLDRFNVNGSDLSVNVWIRNDKYFAAPSSFEGTWKNASDYCESHDSHLASIHSYKDFQRAILECASVNGKCWIGLNDITTEGMWQWSDNTTTDYGFWNDNSSTPTTGIIPWAPGKPNNLGGDQNCVGLDNGVFGDYNCSETWLRPLCKQIDPFCDRGIQDLFGQNACCAFSCGTCGGTNCNARPGGQPKCCTNPITADNITCDHSIAPCVISQSRNPTADPSSSPSNHPTAPPSAAPSKTPTQLPSAAPIVNPTAAIESLEWRKVLKINRAVPIPSPYPTNWAHDWYFEGEPTYGTLGAEEASSDILSSSFELETNNFRSRLIDEWKDDNINVSAVKLAFYDQGNEEQWVIFDTTTTADWNTWLDPQYIMSSSWSDLNPSTSMWYYGIKVAPELKTPKQSGDTQLLVSLRQTNSFAKLLLVSGFIAICVF